jgi:hypothetical protein
VDAMLPMQFDQIFSMFTMLAGALVTTAIISPLYVLGACDGPQTKRHGRFLSSPFLFVVACVLSLSWKTVFFHICFRISHSVFV